MLRRVDIGAAQQVAEVGELRAGVQTFCPLTTHSPPSRTARRGGGEVGPAPAR